ncbi:MAG TPA: SpoIIE family protein phosphatase [Gemmataceae bacterium]|nr:SpoIIE family protein phosphatase [Gemmataceae bacterium]
MAATAARILLCGPSTAAIEDLRNLLEQEGHTTAWHSVDAGEPRELTTCDLVVLDAGHHEHETLELCQRLRNGLADRMLPILLIAPGQNPDTRLAALERGADVCLTRPLAAREFLAQVQAILRLKKRHDRLAEKAAEFVRVHHQLQQSYRQLDQDLDLSRRIQHSMLPRTLPDVPPARFAVEYRPCGRVGGDFYDVFRLDEDHVGFYVADVVGHGLPASLLTIFLKKAIRFKEISQREYRLLAPHEVLQYLNRDLIDQAVADNPFITMVYALFNRRTGCLSFARAGHPHPIHVPHRGEPKLWHVHGPLLGVFDAPFTTETFRLRPGDKLLLHTDGLDSLAPDGTPSAAERLLVLAERHAGLDLEVFVHRLAQDLLQQTGQPDDFTLLALEVRAGESTLAAAMTETNSEALAGGGGRPAPPELSPGLPRPRAPVGGPDVSE